MNQNRTFGNPLTAERHWLKYRLALAGIRYDVISQETGTTETYISRVVRGKHRSDRVEAVIVKLLGFDTWDAMMQTALTEQAAMHKGGAA